MSLTIAANSILNEITNFFLSSETRTYQLDKQKSISILPLLFLRENNLTETASKYNLSIFGLSRVTTSLGTCKALLYGLKQLNANDAYKNILPDIKTLKAYDQKIDDLLNHIDPFVNAACLATYIALIYFGNPLPGIIGISFLALGYLKQQSKLPSYLDNALLKLSIPCSIFSILTTKMHLLTKTALILNIAIKILDIRISNNSNEYISNFRNHKIEEKSTLDYFLKHQKTDLFKEISNTRRFSINKTSVYAFKWPSFFSEEEKKLSNKEIQTKLKELCINLNIIPKEESEKDSTKQYERLEGWKRLSQTLETGSLGEQTPTNLQFFFDLIKSITLSTLKDCDTQNKKNKLENLLKICEQCPAGWTIDVEKSHFPASGLEPTIHKNLAVYRDTLIQAILCKITKTEGRDYFESSGGVNNVHLLDAISVTVWHEWKTFRGELNSHLYGKGILTRWIESSPLLSNDTRNFILFSLIGAIDITLSTKTGLLRAKLPTEMRKLYNARAIIGCIESQVAYGEISWDSVSSWMSKLQERTGIEFISEETSEYNPQWVKELQDPTSKKPKKIKILTKEAITLLLWDLNILSYNAKTANES